MSPLRILVVGSSRDWIEILTEELRRLGHEPEIAQVEDEPSLRTILGTAEWALALIIDDQQAFPVETAVSMIHGADDCLPVVVVCSRDSEHAAILAMRNGAQDYVLREDPRRLGPVVERELANVSLRRAKVETERALVASEARFRAIVEDQTEFVLRWTPDGNRTFVNRAYCEYFGGTPSTVLGTNFVVGKPEDWRGFIQKVVAQLSPENPVVVAEPMVPGPDGELAYHEWVNRGIFDAGGELIEIQSVGRDVTKQRKANEAERQQLLLVEVLRDTAAALNSTLDLDEVFDRILANIGWVIPHNASAIFFAEGEVARVVRQRGWAEMGIDSIPEKVPLTSIEMKALSAMMESGKPMAIQDTTRDERWEPGTRRLRWVRSFAAAPLFDESELFGVLALFCDRPDYFTEIHMELLKGFASHAATASRNARLYEAMRKSRRELRGLSARIVEAQEIERRKLSRELHDEIGQSLTAIIINSELLLSQSAGRDRDSTTTRLSEVASLAKEALVQVRDLSHRLRPAMLDELGLVPTLEWFTRRYAEWSGIEVVLDLIGMEEDRPDPIVETVLYRVVQEALTNVVRHAEASRVEVELVREANHVSIRIEDDGVGFGPDEVGRVGDPSSGIGLLGMNERISNLGGSLSFESSATGGVKLDAVVPLVTGEG